MIPVDAPGGMVEAQARIASIRARIHQFAPTGQGAFTLGTVPTAGTTDAVPVGSAAAGATSTAVASAATLRAPAPPAASGGPPAAAEARLAQLLPPAGRSWAGPIARAAEKHGVDAGLLAALVQHESGFDPAARSHAGAIGLGQLMPGTAAGLGVDPTDPVQNLDGAARYLKQQLDRFGSADLALAAYNAGPSRVAHAGGIPNITETRNYVARVTKTWEQYR